MKRGRINYRCPSELTFTVYIGQNCKYLYQQFKIYLIVSNNQKEDDVRKIINLLNIIMGPHGVKMYNNFKKKSKESFDGVIKAF